jgi:acyl carrier protein
MDAFQRHVVEHILRDLQITDVDVEALDGDSPLFGDDGLGLDSLDAVEVSLVIERHYGVHIGSETEGRVAFPSVNSLATFIRKRRPIPADRSDKAVP